MKQLRILNTREIREIISKLEEQYGCALRALQRDYAFLMDQKDKIYIISRDVDLIDFEKLRINSMGLYFAELGKGNQLRLTMEGSQIVGPHAVKSVVELNKEQVKQYFQGQEVDIAIDVEGQPFVLMKYKNDFFGAAKYKDGKILNYLPKVHRTMELIL